MKIEDRNYYRRRADEEQANAAKALSAEAKHAHLAMAERYQALADSDQGMNGEKADGCAVWPASQPASPAT